MVLNKIELKHFKAFQSLNLPLSNLTLLAGMNGVGKSSIIQAILLLRQSHQMMKNQRFILQLNGSYIELGNLSDVFYNPKVGGAKDSELIIGLEYKQNLSLWRFERQSNRDYFELKDESSIDSQIYQSPIFQNSFHYLQAERNGPRVISSMSDYDINEGNLGKSGEYTSHFLAHWGDERIEENLAHESEQKTFTLVNQVNAWMTVISPNIEISAYMRPEISAAELRINGYRPTNVGFGISYTLPVLVSLLSARKGDLILLENPEAHLHPRGQSEIGKLIAKVAGIGAQVIVETHSDHIFNGIRLGIKEGNLSRNDATFAFFNRSSNSHETMVEFPEIDENGKFIGTPPKYFFDEYRRAMRDLL